MASRWSALVSEEAGLSEDAPLQPDGQVPARLARELRRPQPRTRVRVQAVADDQSAVESV
jgi:hypothetical protein